MKNKSKPYGFVLTAFFTILFFLTPVILPSSSVYAEFLKLKEPPSIELERIGGSSLFDSEDTYRGAALRAKAEVDSVKSKDLMKVWTLAETNSGPAFARIRGIEYQDFVIRGDVPDGTRVKGDLLVVYECNGLANAGRFGSGKAFFYAKLNSGLLLEENKTAWDNPALGKTVFLSTNDPDAPIDWTKDLLEMVNKELAGQLIEEGVKTGLKAIGAGAAATGVGIIVTIIIEVIDFVITYDEKQQDQRDIDCHMFGSGTVRYEDLWFTVGGDFGRLPGRQTYGNVYRTFLSLDIESKVFSLPEPDPTFMYTDFYNHPPHYGDRGGKLRPRRGFRIMGIYFDPDENNIVFPKNYAYPVITVDEFKCFEPLKEAPMRLGEKQTIMIKFVNKGKGAARPCTVRVTTPDPRKSFDIQLKQSYAGGYVYQFDYVFDKLGDNDFVITIDPQGKLDEFTDLTHRKVFTINVEPLPDLKIEFEHMPEEIEIDKQASFWVSVKNVGNRTSPATKVQFLANNKVVQEKNTKSFEKGGEELLQFKWLPKEKRTYDLIFRVDTDNKIKENFEDNNQCHRKIEVSAPKYNWFIKPNSLMVSPSDPKPGEDARIYFTVENAGQSHEGILYYVLVDDKRIKRSVAWVKPNSRYTVGVDKAVTWRVTGGAHKIKVILNPEKEFPDLGKESIQELSISPKLPMSSVAGLDFMIRKEDISLDMRNLMMIIKVYNRGTKSGVAEVRFYHYRSGKEEPRLRYPAKLFSFPAQSVQTFHLELTPDHYSSKFEIIVDKDNMVKETDEGNNTASYTFPDYEPYKPPPLPERAKAPDLVIDHISIDRSLELGETMSIEIGFGNMNLVDAEGVIVRYEIWNTDRRARDWDAAHGHLKGEKNIGTVKAESRGQFVVDYKGVYPGPYRINVKIDPDRKIKEIDSWFNNNELRKDFSVEGEITPALYFFDKNVDLAIDKEVSVSDSNPSAGTTKVVFKVTARNNSDIVVWGADLDMFIDDELEAGERLGDFPAQSEKTFTFINTFLATGDYTVKFMVDPKEAVPETDEGNNTVTTVIKVKPGIFGTGHRDVAVTSFSLSKTSCLQGEPVTATATIKNVGKDILRAVLCTIGPQGRRPVYVKIQPILDPGQEIKISTTLPALFVGDHIIEARVDGKNLYIETNEENNAKSASLHVEAITKEKVKERVEEKAEEKAGEIIETIDRWLRGLGKP